LIAEKFKNSPKLNKSESINMLVALNAPFIPFTILNEHLKRGLLKYKGKAKFPPVSWAKHYSDFCANVPFGSDLPDDDLSNQRKSEKLALAIDFWKEATTAHNANVPAAKVLSLSEDEIDKLSGSQFSLSVGGTPEFHKPPTPLEKELRAKLLLVSSSLNANREKIRQAEELERKAAALRGSMSVAPSVAPGKRKPDADDASQHDAPVDNGMHALDVFLSAIKRKVELAEYIDFASMSAQRLKEIKMLNCTSSKSSKIATGLVLRHSLSEADVTTLTDDFSQITDGFLFHYLKVISESNLDDPMATVIDRLSWWQWICHVFGANVAAQVKFIKNFLVEHHGEPFWTPLVKLETNLVLLCKEQAPLHAQKASKKEPSGKPSGKGGGKHGSSHKPSGPRVVFTTAQQAKLESWKSRFPGFCISRLVRGRTCNREKNGGVCKYTHNCAWCGSAGCKADCAQAESF
jgi:hypothetical protein